MPSVTDQCRAPGSRTVSPPVVAHEHGATGGQHLADDLGDRLAGGGVQPLPRLVEHQQAGRAQQRLRQADLLRGALGQPGQADVVEPGQAEALDPVTHRPVGGGTGQAGDAAHGGQVGPDGERLVGGEALRHPADHRRPVGDPAPGRAQHPGGELQQRGLSGPVAAEHHGDLARADGDVDLPQDPGAVPVVAEPDAVEPHAPTLPHRTDERGPATVWWRSPVRDVLVAQASVEASCRFFTTFGSTGTPGPMVVVRVTFLRYVPLAADGLARSTSSSTAA